MVNKEERGVLGVDELGSLIILTGALAVSSGFRAVAGEGILRKRGEDVCGVHIQMVPDLRWFD